MIRLAWRNIWRNRRRSLITIASLGCGLAAIMFGQSLIKTIQFQLIEKATGVITGHLQVMDARVKEVKFPERPIDDAAAVERALAGVPGVAAFESRILMTGLVSSTADSIGVLIVGVEPDRDPRITRMHGYVTAGSFLTGRPKEIVMGDAMARTLRVALGDRVVVMAQSSDGSMGAENFTLAGVFHTGSETFDGQIVYVPLASLEETLSMEGKPNDVVLRLQDPERLPEAKAELARVLSGLPVRVLGWGDVDQELVGIQRYQNAIMNILLLIIFSIVAMGILNTLLMSMFERIREFGVLKAVGARPGWIVRLVLAESCLLGLSGGAAGTAAGAALIAHYGKAGLRLPLKEAINYFLPFDTDLYLRFHWPAHRLALTAVLAVCVLAGLPPAWRASRLKPAEALRHL